MENTITADIHNPRADQNVINDDLAQGMHQLPPVEKAIADDIRKLSKTAFKKTNGEPIPVVMLNTHRQLSYNHTNTYLNPGRPPPRR